MRQGVPENRLKARSHDPFLRIRFLVPKTGSRRRSDGPISRFRFCCENVGRSFAVCSHDPFFRTNKESSIWRQNDDAKFVGAFHLSRRKSDENRACSISIRFFKIKDPFDGRSFLMCSHDPFFGNNKNRILKNGSCEQVLKLKKCSVLQGFDGQFSPFYHSDSKYLPQFMLACLLFQKLIRRNVMRVSFEQK